MSVRFTIFSFALMGKSKIDVWDGIALFVYFGAVVIVSILAMFRSNRGTKEGYFLAGRFMTWLPVGASLFASNIGSEHFIGLAGSGAAKGIGVGAFELNACLLLQVLGWVFLPVYIASKVCTLPEYMNKRFGGTRIQIYLATLSLILYVFTKISVNLYSGALFIQVAVGWNIWVSVLPLLVVSTFITITGGLAAVIYTDTLQCFLMVIGGSIVMISAFVEVGGFSGLYDQYFHAISDTAKLAATNSSIEVCNEPSDNAFVMLRGLTDPDMPWLGFLLGQTPASIWYWCADQMMVQRALASKSLSHAQGGAIFAGLLKFTPLFMLVFPGMISRVLFPNEVGCATREECMAACGSPVSCSNIAYPKLVMKLMPSGLRGVMLAVMLAALMSDLTSIFNSASTLFTIDIYGKIKKAVVRRNSQNSKEKTSENIKIVKDEVKLTNLELMIVGRLFVLVMVLASVAWIPMIQNMQGGQLYIYIQSMAADLSPPIAAVYLVAVFWRRANEKGAFWGLFVGFVVGVTRMIVDMIFRAPSCGEADSRPWIVAKFHYMYFALFLFVVTIAVIFVVSLLTEPDDSYKTCRTTFWTRFDEAIRPDEVDDARGTIHLSEIVGSSTTDAVEAKELNSWELADQSRSDNNDAAAETQIVVPQFANPGKGGAAKRFFVWLLGIDYDPASTENDNWGGSSRNPNNGHHQEHGFNKTVSPLSDQHPPKLSNEVNHATREAGAEQHISSVKQDPKAKLLLGFLLIMITTVDILNYLYFSIATKQTYPPPAS